MKSIYEIVKYNSHWTNIYKILDFIVDSCR
jgi:hypothetical protein